MIKVLSLSTPKFNKLFNPVNAIGEIMIIPMNKVKINPPTIKFLSAMIDLTNSSYLKRKNDQKRPFLDSVLK